MPPIGCYAINLKVFLHGRYPALTGAARSTFGCMTAIAGGNVRVRPATSGDLESIRRLYRQLHRADPALTEEIEAATFELIEANPALDVLLLEVEGEVLATAYLNVIPNLTRGARPYAVIENVVVDERVRGTGLGKVLMAGVLERAWAADCYKAMLMTGSSTESVHAYYRATGFDPDAKQAYLARP